MNYIESFNLFGVPAQQITCVKLHGAPTETTEGAVGVIGMDVDSPYHELYKCTSAENNTYTWERAGNDFVVTCGVYQDTDGSWSVTQPSATYGDLSGAYMTGKNIKLAISNGDARMTQYANLAHSESTGYGFDVVINGVEYIIYCDVDSNWSCNVVALATKDDTDKVLNSTLKSTGWGSNKYLVTDENGNVTETNIDGTITSDYDFGFFKGAVNSTDGSLNTDIPSGAALNNFATPITYFNKLSLYLLADNIMFKICYYDKNGTYISSTSWQSKTQTTWSSGGVDTITIDKSYVRLAIADTTLNSTYEYTLSIDDYMTRFNYVITPVEENTTQSELQGKKWLFIGDSITEHNFRATKNYDEYLSDWLGITSINVAKSGTGVTYPFQNSPSWLEALSSYPEDVDVISVMGALNDRHNTLGQWGDKGTDTVYGGVWNFFNNLIEKYPNKPIIYITSTPREYSYGEDGQYTEWVDAFIKTARHFSIPTLDLYRNSGLRPWNTTNNLEYFSCDTAPNGDGVHPNHKGQLLIAKKIAPFAEQYLVG